MPDKTHTSANSPSCTRWPGVLSPAFAGSGFWNEHGPAENSRAFAAHRGSTTSEELSSHRGSYDHSMFITDDYGMDDGDMSNLNIHDRSPGSPKAGSKRRASSPPRERDDRSSISSAHSHQGEIYHRRSLQQLPNRASPVSRFHPSHSSISSTSSFGPRHGSLGSSLGIASVPSSATSYASGRISPSALSPAMESDPRYGTPYTAAKAPNPTSPVAQHQRTASESTQGSGAANPTSVPESASNSRTASLSHMQGIYICECCPKKPKKFDSADDLR
jgi:hypothetical protein